MTLILANIALILTIRAGRGSPAANPAFRWVGGGAVAFLVVCLAIPGLRSLFRFDPLHRDDLAAAALAIASVVALFAGVVKLLEGRGRSASL